MNETSEQWNEFKKKRVSITESEIENMLSLRDKARENKNYKEADRIRDELLDKGVLIEDKDGKTLGNLNEQRKIIYFDTTLKRWSSNARSRFFFRR